MKPKLLRDHHKYLERADTQAALAGAGWRLDEHGYSGTVLTHNERWVGLGRGKEHECRAAGRGCMFGMPIARLLQFAGVGHTNRI
jgi:hypothetical protein